MKTQVLLSTATTLPRLEVAFRIGHDLGFHGLEIMPYRWTNPDVVTDFAVKYSLPIKGIHFPFWWQTKSLLKVCQSEQTNREKVFALIWSCIFGPGHLNCAAADMRLYFRDAYLLLHPDTWHQMSPEDQRLLFGQKIFFENERPKLGEGEDTYDPCLIYRDIIKKESENLFGHWMMDPGHIQIATNANHLKPIPLALWYQQLRPKGLHLSFSDAGRLHELPNPEEWEELVPKIKAAPPEWLVIETKPGRHIEHRLHKARELISRDLGI